MPSDAPPPGLVLGLALAGGAVGSLVRAAVALFVTPPGTAGAFPLHTLLVNVVGTFILGLLGGLATRRDVLQPWVMPAVGTGFCGGLTTMSSFVVDVLKLGAAGRYELAAVYFAATLVATLAVGAGGWALAGLLGTPDPALEGS